MIQDVVQVTIYIQYMHTYIDLQLHHPAVKYLNEFGCYEAKIEESEKRPAAARS